MMLSETERDLIRITSNSSIAISEAQGLMNVEQGSINTFQISGTACSDIAGGEREAAGIAQGPTVSQRKSPSVEKLLAPDASNVEQLITQTAQEDATKESSAGSTALARTSTSSMTLPFGVWRRRQIRL